MASTRKMDSNEAVAATLPLAGNLLCLGKTGSGKSTLMEMLAERRLDQPDGRCWFLDPRGTYAGLFERRGRTWRDPVAGQQQGCLSPLHRIGDPNASVTLAATATTEVLRASHGHGALDLAGDWQLLVRVLEGQSLLRSGTGGNGMRLHELAEALEARWDDDEATAQQRARLTGMIDEVVFEWGDWLDGGTSQLMGEGLDGVEIDTGLSQRGVDVPDLGRALRVTTLAMMIQEVLVGGEVAAPTSIVVDDGRVGELLGPLVRGCPAALTGMEPGGHGLWVASQMIDPDLEGRGGAPLTGVFGRQVLLSTQPTAIGRDGSALGLSSDEADMWATVAYPSALLREVTT